MKYARLGNTEIEVSVVSFGTSPFGQDFGPVSFDQARSALLHGLDLGINFIDTSPYYGDAEERLGKMSKDIPDDIIIGTKAGRYGDNDFDFSPKSIRESLDRSLKRLKRDHVDILQLHDIDFGDLDFILTESFEELVALKNAGKCRAIGMTCYSVPAIQRVLAETDVDVFLNFSHGTLLDDSLTTILSPLARQEGVGIMNAAAVSLGLLTPRILDEDFNPTSTNDLASSGSIEAARGMARAAHEHGVSISLLANQYAIQSVECDTTVIGTTNSAHLEEAVRAATEPLDQVLLDAILEFRVPIEKNQWNIGRPENQVWR